MFKKYRAVAYAHAYPGTSFAAGGETTLHDLLTPLVADGWDVDLVLSQRSKNDRGDYTIDGVRVHDYTDKQQPNRMIPSADVVISHLGGAQRAGIIARGNKIPSVQVIHNDLDYTKAMARHAQFLVYNTEWVLESFRNSRHVRPPGMVVHPPVDPAKYRVRSKRKYITLVNLSDGDGGPYDKGSRMFYEMAKRFPEEQFLGVIGAYGHQDIREMPNVTIVPNDDDIKKYYAQTKIVLSPSNYESYGRISVEAACSGIPSITSLAPGFREHGVASHLVDYLDTDGWERAIRSVLDYYSLYSRQAKAKASALWKQSQRELSEYVAALDGLANSKRARQGR